MVISNNKSNKNLLTIILCFLIGFATYYFFLSLTGYATALIIGSPISRLYFKDFVSLFGSISLRKVLISAFWLPIEAIIVVLLISSFSYFLIKPDAYRKWRIIVPTVAGAIFSDLVWTTFYLDGQFDMTVFFSSGLFSPAVALIVNISIWFVYSFFSFSLVSWLQKISMNLKYRKNAQHHSLMGQQGKSHC